jgi:aminomethyltransferase
MTGEAGLLQRTPLYEAAVAAGGRMVPFGGWEMPVQFAGIKIEHAAVRERAGLFDISHMGQFSIAGADAVGFLTKLLPARVQSLQVGQMLYAPMCNQGGGCVDDVVVYRLAPDRFMLVVNAARLQADWTWVNRWSSAWANLQVEDLSQAKGMVALQGPRAADIVAGLTDTDIASLSYYCCRGAEVGGIQVLLSRNGYTGEDGFEFMAAAEHTGELWHTLLAAGAVPCGLGARDTLRMEMGFCLYGHELDEDITPLEAGLGWTVDFAKDDVFIGGEKLAELRRVGGHRRLRGLKMLERGIPRAGYPILDTGGNEVGTVTSGTPSPTLEQGIGLGYIKHGSHRIGTRVDVEMRGKKCPAEVVKLPFVQAGVKRA